MGNIVLLDDLTINKIAAGEVIERPASVVKELIENSIDAGATNITAEIKNGGITYIRITDNGKGFLPDDMEIAFEKHATSKIRNAKDLEEVKTMGFRGEALASIAAIARVELISKTADSEIGYKIVVEGGKVINKEVTGCPRGTTIIVENLFFNTPVRYKFLKKDFTELGYVEDAVTRLALVNPGISVKLQTLGKTLIQTTGNGNIKDTVYNIYGKDIAENIINIDYVFEDVRVTGCIGKPEIAKANRTGQLFFVNGRYVKDRTLTSAAEQAFKGIVPAGKYGFLVLNLNIDSHQIDVNVHPAKLEIRFQEENKVFKLVYHAIKEAISNNITKNENENKDENKDDDILELIKEGYNTKFDVKELKRQRDYIYSKPEDIVQDEEKVVSNTGNLIEDIYNDRLRQNAVEDISEEIMRMEEKNNNENSSNTENMNIDEPIQDDITNVDTNYGNIEGYEKAEEDLSGSFEEMYRKTFGVNPVEKNETQNYESKEKVDIKIAEKIEHADYMDAYNSIHYKFIGIAFSLYIVIQIDDEMYLIDQRAANEKIIFNKLKESYYSSGNRESQMMLLPDIIELTSKQMDIARDNMLLLRKAGFEYEEFGENTIKLVGVPDICIDLETKDLFVKILEEINKVARTSKNEIEEKFITTIAASVAKNEKIAVTFEEVDSLMKKLLVLEKPFSNSDGSSIAISLSKSEIEKKISK